MKAMIKVILLFLTLGTIAACNEDDDDDSNNCAPEGITGSWLLVEQLLDPGDGSGTFVPVESDKTITFNADGNFTCNGNICELTTTADFPTSGTYSLADSTLYPDECLEPFFPYTFDVDGSFMVISYPCIEACRMKYAKQF